MANLSKLDAVNRILTKCGFGSVPSLETNGASVTSEAERHIDMATAEIQAEGWHFNTRSDVEATPDGSDNITLPSGTIEMDTDGESADIDVAQVGSMLYDKDENTDEFDSTLRTEQTLNYSFGCIPLRVQLYIVSIATVSFARVWKPMEQALIRRLEGEVFRHKVQAKRFDGKARDVNVLATPDMLRAAGRVRGNYDQRRVP